MGLPDNCYEMDYRIDDKDQLLITKSVPLGGIVHNRTQMITIQSLIGYRSEELKSFATSFSLKVFDQCSKGDHEFI